MLVPRAGWRNPARWVRVVIARRRRVVLVMNESQAACQSSLALLLFFARANERAYRSNGPLLVVEPFLTRLVVAVVLDAAAVVAVASERADLNHN